LLRAALQSWACLWGQDLREVGFCFGTTTILSQSSGVAQALEKILSPAIIECMYGTIGLLVLGVYRALAIPHCITYKAVALEQIEY